MGFERLKFMCGAKVGEFIYASCMQFNGLAKINSITGDCKILGKFPNEPLCGDLSCISEENTELDELKKKEPKKTKRAKKSSRKEEKPK